MIEADQRMKLMYKVSLNKEEGVFLIESCRHSNSHMMEEGLLATGSPLTPVGSILVCPVEQKCLQSYWNDSQHS